MKLIIPVLSLLIFQLQSFAQSPKIFEVKESVIDNAPYQKRNVDLKRDSNFFEDEKYIVRATCSGEWGGSVWFKNKKTGKERSCSASCPVIINKQNNAYIVTASLDHMRGFSQIIKIDNPEKLSIFKLPKAKMINGKPFRYTGTDESKSVKGTKILLDTIGALVVCSFIYHDQLYHIVTSHENTFVAKIENKKFQMIQLISNRSLYPTDFNIIKNENGHLYALFQARQSDGYLDIYQNKIDVIYYPVKPTTKILIKHF